MFAFIIMLIGYVLILYGVSSHLFTKQEGKTDEDNVFSDINCSGSSNRRE